MIPLNALCTCGHTLAAHADSGDAPCAKTIRQSAPRGCACTAFTWDNGKVAD